MNRKLAMAAVVALVAGIGLVGWVRQSDAQEGHKAPSAKGEVKEQVRPAKKELDKLQGTWTVISSEGRGGNLTTITFTDNKYKFTYRRNHLFEANVFDGTVEFLNLKDNPIPGNCMLRNKQGRTALATFTVIDDKLWYFGNDTGWATRPLELTAKENDGRYSFVLKRSKP